MNIGDKVKINEKLQRNLTKQREVFLGKTGTVTGINNYGVTLDISGDLLMWDSEDLEVLPRGRKPGKRNFLKLLKGHEGRRFYSPAYGDILVTEIDEDSITIKTPGSTEVKIAKDGTFLDGNKKSECMIFPSKNQRNWEKWEEEQKAKTWGGIIRVDKYLNKDLDFYNDVKLIGDIQKSPYYFETPLKNSILSLYKIRKLIEIGYGGNITNDEWNDMSIAKYTIKRVGGKFKILAKYIQDLVAFHTTKQAEEFLSNPENIKLLENLYI